ncbi:hypothetical protein [Streptomyces synnematoformans]|uniref:hypothetical protein n=1 Tax=Streptomyces synnematoformans TaxID=415721 RepID=UPI0031CF7C2A
MSALLAGASAAIAGLLLAGCADDKSPDARPLPKGKSAEMAASSRPDMEQAEALAAYRSWWRDLAAVSATPDPASPRLNDHAMGGALELMKHGLETAQKQMVVARGTPRPNPEISSASRDMVVIRDCVDGTDWLQYKQNGELKNDVPGGHFKVDASVRRVDSTWKVSDLYMHEAGSC